MNKDDSIFDLDNDPQFNENLNENIESELGDKDIISQKQDQNQEPEKMEKPESLSITKEETKEENAENKVTDTGSINHSLNDLEDVEIQDKLMDINASLAKQISDEINFTVEEKKLKKKKKKFKVLIGIGITVFCILATGLFLGFTKPGNDLLLSMGVNASGTLWSSMTHEFDDGTNVKEDVDYIDDEDKKSDAPEVDPATITWPIHPGDGRHEDGVYNILLLGEESIGMGDRRGHTDVIVIATMNTKNKTLKLTSLMRDNYVQIPGYNDNKLNVAYAKGGLDLLYETIAKNFDIKLDGCVKVNFENFENIVNRIGGVDITLKQVEADYLNTTNYISNKKYRNVKAGLNHFNGNQALGYARIRKISTITGNNNDYGRTDRHRILLNAIFEKCKSKSKAELASMMVDFLYMITTDINGETFQGLLNSFIDMGMNTQKIEQLRIPVDGTFQDNIKIRGMSVVVPDLEKNITALHSFIFGDPLPTVTPDSGEKTTN